MFCALAEESIGPLQPRRVLRRTPRGPARHGEAARWFILNRIRRLAETGRLHGHSPAAINRFLVACRRSTG